MTTVRVEGVKQAIVELRKIDPELRKTFNANVRQITKPLVDDAKRVYRGTQFPSGTKRNWSQNGRVKFPLDNAKAVRGVKSKISTSKRNASTILVGQFDPGAAIYEFAAAGNLGNSFGKKNGGTPRVMWPAADRNLDAVTANMAALVEQASDEITRRLA